MLRLVLFLVGFGFSIIGCVYIIAYLNYLTIGYTFLAYLRLIITRFECLLAFIGITLMCITIFSER